MESLKNRNGGITLVKIKQLGTPTEKLRAYRQDLLDTGKKIVVAVGLPLTGKTRQALDCAMKDIQGGHYDKIIIVRSPLASECGYLKGSYMDKMTPYLRQANIYCSESSGEGMNLTVEEMVSRGIAEVCEPNFLQGNRYDRCIVYVDEAQNIHKEWAFKVMTRIGKGTKFIIIGDISKGQANRKVRVEDSLPAYLMKKFAEKDYVGIHKFYDKDKDILGDEVAKDIMLTLMDDFV